LIRKVCEAGTFAPSGGNRQPWKFIAVTDPERRRWVAERYRAVFREYIADAVAAARDPAFPESRRRMQRAAIHLAEHLHEAPVHLFVAGWTRRGEAQLQALMPCVMNVLLACRAVGLGASLTTLHRNFGAECDAWLNLPPDCPTCALLPHRLAAGPLRPPAPQIRGRMPLLRALRPRPRGALKPSPDYSPQPPVQQRRHHGFCKAAGGGADCRAWSLVSNFVGNRGNAVAAVEVILAVGLRTGGPRLAAECVIGGQARHGAGEPVAGEEGRVVGSSSSCV